MATWQRFTIRAGATGCCGALGSVSWADGDYFAAVVAFALAAGLIFDFATTPKETGHG